jgi:hypothetical protein
MIVKGKNSAIDLITNSSAFGRAPHPKKPVYSKKRKYFSSNVPSSHRTDRDNHKKPGFEMPVEDFVTNVGSIKPLPHDNGSAF